MLERELNLSYRWEAPTSIGGGGCHYIKLGAYRLTGVEILVENGEGAMFTGIVETVGTLRNLVPGGKGARIEVDAPNMDFSDVVIGASIACNGVCVTVTSLVNQGFTADISHETMACTTFKYLGRGSRLNLEKALTPHKHLGGHIVQGHVDGTGTVMSVNKSDDVLDVWIETTPEVSRYIAKKGSITVDGISLTVNDVEGNSFRLTLIPHTHKVTTADFWAKGQEVNLEADVLARYIERLLACKDETASKSSGLTADMLAENGFF